jgi:hypothetical protein
MKGNVLRPRWPAPGSKTASHSKPSGSLKKQEEKRVDTSNRITLSLLEEHSLSPEHARGYDPYATASRPADVWRRKPKRD